jgi:hypothetical protein
MTGVTNTVLRALEHLERRGHEAMVLASGRAVPPSYAGAPVVRARSVPDARASVAGRTGRRPWIGALFGVVFFVLLNAGILQAVKLPDERDRFLYFVAAITFLAGFSERRAQDILVRASPLGGDKPSEQTASPPPR